MRFIFISLFIFFNLFSFGQKNAPSWVKNWGKTPKYPSSVYLTGMSFVTANDIDDESAFELAFDNAKANLSEKLLQQITSTSNLIQEEINDQYNEQMSAQVSIKTKVDITGIEYEQPYFDEKGSKLYLLVYAPINKMKLLYSEKWNSVNHTLKAEFESAEFLESENNKTKALSHYYKCQNLMGERDEYSTILACLGSKQKLEKDDITTSAIQTKITQLNDVKIASLDDLIYDILQSFQKQMKEPAKGVTIANPLLAPLKVATNLSKHLKSELQIACTNQLKWKITHFSEWKEVKEITPEIIERFRYTIHSNYRIEGLNIVFRSDIFDMVEEKNVCTYYSMFPKSVFEKTKIQYEPTSIGSTMEQQKAFLTNELPPSPLTLKITTNKGNETPVFEDGDFLKIGYKINSPSYIRIIFYAPDGKKILIEDNFYAENTNKLIKLAKQLEIKPPFGVATLQVNASSEEFAHLKTSKNDFGQRIISNTLEETLKITRNSSEENIVKTEKRLLITIKDREE